MKIDWIFEIPGLTWFLRQMIDERKFNSFTLTHILISVVLYFLPLHKWFPFGPLYFNMRRTLHQNDEPAPEAEAQQPHKMKSKSKLAEKANSKKQIKQVKGMSKLRYKTFPPWLGVFLSHAPCPIVYVYIQLFYPSGNLTSIPSLAFLLYAVYRAFVYPWFRNKYATEIPRVTVALYAAISAHIGFCASRITALSPNLSFQYAAEKLTMILRTTEKFKDITVMAYHIEYVILVPYLASFIYLVMHDWVICRARNEKGYEISMYAQNKWGWQRVSCPQYCWTFLTYFVWTFFLGDFVESLSFLIYVAVLTVVRADVVHSFLCQAIPGYAYSGRNPCFFFLAHSKAFLRFG